MSELEDDVMTESEYLAGIAVTMLQIRDYAYIIAASLDKDNAGQVEAIHDAGGLLLDLPVYRDDTNG